MWQSLSGLLATFFSCNAFVVLIFKNAGNCVSLNMYVCIQQARMAYVMPQMPVVAQPVITQPVLIAPTGEAKRDGPNMGSKQNVYVWASDECGCCNDCSICESPRAVGLGAYSSQAYYDLSAKCRVVQKQ